MLPRLYIDENEDVQLTFEHLSFIQIKDQYKVIKVHKGLGKLLLEFNVEAPHYMALLLMIEVVRYIPLEFKLPKLETVKKWAEDTVHYYSLQLNNGNAEQYYKLDIDEHLDGSVCGILRDTEHMYELFNNELNRFSYYHLPNVHVDSVDLESLKVDMKRYLKTDNITTALLRVDVGYRPKEITDVTTFIRNYIEYVRERGC